MVDQASELEALELILTDANAEPTNLSYALIKSITANFSKEIGRGGFGVVYLGVLRNEKVAVKKLFIEQDFSDELFVDEVNSLVRAKHNNIVRFLGYCADTQGELVKFDGRHVMAEVRQRLLCFEYVPNGNLHDYIKGISHGDEWQIRYKMIKGICHGLQYLHKERITHLDLKPENVLLDAYMEPKITDFGLSRVFDEGQSRVFTKNVLGTRGYIAPEIIDKGEISFKSDIFALGIVVSKLLVGRNNYDIENWHESLDVDCTKAKSCIQIAQSCMDADQHKRPTAEEIIKKLNEMESLGSSIYRTNSPDSENLIQVEPLELHFHLEPNTHISASQKLKLANITDDYVAFNVMEWSSMAKYGFSWSGPSRGILLPWSTHELGLIREAHEMSPLSVQCNDVLIVRSTVVSEGFKTHYITPDMFKTHMGRKVHEVKLGILVAPTLAESSALASDTLSMPPAENQDHEKAKEEFHRLGLSAHERPHGTDAQISQESETSTERLAINPLELRFPFEQNKLIVCGLYLRNNTDLSFAFRLVPGSPKRYYEKGLCGNIPPKSTYTLFVRMRGCQEPPPHKDEFVIQSSVMSDDELKDIRKGRADIDYCNFFADVKEKNVRKVHELTLQAVFEPQRETTNVEVSSSST